MTIMQQVEALQRKIVKQDGKPNKADTNKLAKAKESVRKIIASGKASAAVAKEAEAFINSF